MTAVSEIHRTPAEQGFMDQFDQGGAKLPGNAWVRELRSKAMRRFGETGLPHRRIEEWKYTDLRLMLKEALTPAGDELAKVSDTDLYKALGGDLHGISAHHIVFVDGVYDEDNSFIISDEASQVFMTPLREVLDNPPDWFKERFGGDELVDDPTVALNTAFMGDGAVIEIVKGAKLKRPVHLIHVSTSSTGEAITERNIIEVEEGASATILESYVHLRSPDVQRNCLTEMNLGKGAKISHIKFQHEGARATHLSNWNISVGPDADYRGFQFTLGARLCRNNINVSFDGAGAKGDISGIALLWDEQHADTTMKIVHAAPDTQSRELFKTVLDDSARAVFQGKLVVRPEAQKTDAKQMAHGMMLSDGAEFDAKPELEIYADDVQCGHGATSGQLDEDMMFYMRQRGMSEETVQTLLILAFVGEALELIEDDNIKDAFTAAATAWLGGKSDE